MVGIKGTAPAMALETTRGAEVTGVAPSLLKAAGVS